jgi:hypothetical protein
MFVGIFFGLGRGQPQSPGAIAFSRAYGANRLMQLAHTSIENWALGEYDWPHLQNDIHCTRGRGGIPVIKGTGLKQV